VARDKVPDAFEGKPVSRFVAEFKQQATTQTGGKLVKLKLAPSMMEQLKAECHPVDPSEIFELEFETDAELEAHVPEGDERTLH
jgi:hypothetical protein